MFPLADGLQPEKRDVVARDVQPHWRHLNMQTIGRIAPNYNDEPSDGLYKVPHRSFRSLVVSAT